MNEMFQLSFSTKFVWALQDWSPTHNTQSPVALPPHSNLQNSNLESSVVTDGVVWNLVLLVAVTEF